MSHQQPKNPKQPQDNCVNNGDSNNKGTGQPAQQPPKPLQLLCGRLSWNPPSRRLHHMKRGRRNAIAETYWPYAISHLFLPSRVCPCVYRIFTNCFNLFAGARGAVNAQPSGPNTSPDVPSVTISLLLVTIVSFLRAKHNYKREDPVRPTLLVFCPLM